ncbi:MAG: flagellar hook-basal body complex protein FliE [Alphaproteobacteria bacterium]|mgnify:CR=1 FL=1|nr:flagellar hook-basal body complex protein FliE [Alphaproteobacteria bacterium]
MAIDPLSASKAYMDVARNAMRGGGVEAGDTVDFGQMVQNAIGDAVGAAQGAEQAGLAAASGKADIVNVVTAIAQAETTLETVMAVRDQVIQAYQEILRMPI